MVRNPLVQSTRRMSVVTAKCATITTALTTRNNTAVAKARSREVAEEALTVEAEAAASEAPAIGDTRIAIGTTTAMLTIGDLVPARKGGIADYLSLFFFSLEQGLDGIKLPL